MTEELSLQEELAQPEPSPPQESSANSELNEADKRRMVLGSSIGGVLFLGVLITLIVLLTRESLKPHPTPKPPPKPDLFPHYNPYFVDAFVIESERVMRVSLVNRRKELEPPKETYGYVPIVRESLENHEPKRLQVVVHERDEHLTHFLYFDPDLSRWYVPHYGNHSDPYARAAQYAHFESGFKLLPDVNESFQWIYRGKFDDQHPLLSTAGCRLQYFDKYLEFEVLIERDYVYGMGERIETFHLKNDNYSLWNHYFPYDLGGDTERGMYSSHPFILTRLGSHQHDDFNAIFMRNSNAMLFSMWDHLHNGTTLNYKMVGGMIDLYFFHTADPQYILRKYHSVIGRPYLPPIWAMGLQLAKEKYTVKDFERIIERHQNLSVPVDGLWADTEMNENKKTFTVNKDSFAGIKELVQRMHDPVKGVDMHFVAIANPWIVKDQSYKYYTLAVEQNCLIMSAAHLERPFEGRTVAGTSVWLDFFRYQSTLIWAGGLYDLHELTLFDGIWISENEITHECSGECGYSETVAEERGPNPNHNKSEFDYLQFRPTLEPLEDKTLPMAAYHDGDEHFHKQFFTHNLFGLQIAQATYASLYSIFEGRRSLVASRSTWAGSGQFASHWLDGNYATWSSMESSIPSVLNFNMFGIPHVGAPIGGFFGDCSSELLVRWYELAAFYPLMLTYSGASVNSREPFEHMAELEYIKNTLNERYALIRFMYTKMFEAHMWGGAVVHPLFFDFTNDTKLYDREVLDRTFMWSNSLYIIPALIPHQTSVKAYLPNWRWYDLRTYEMITNYIEDTTEGSYVNFNQPLGHITVLIKGGVIIPYQHLTGQSVTMNVKDLEKIPARLIVAPDHHGKARGSFMVDDERTPHIYTPRTNTHRHYVFTYMNQIFRINKLAGFDFETDHEFDYFWELMILDVMGKHRVDFVCMTDMYMRKRELRYFKLSDGKAMVIHDPQTKKISMRTMESIVWGSSDHHNFCSFQVQITNMKMLREGREIEGELETTNPDFTTLKFSLSALALTNHIAYLKIRKNEGVAEWEVPEVVDRSVREVKATKTLDAVGFGISHPHEDFYFEMSEEYDPHDFLLSTRNQPFVYVRNFIQVRFLVAGRHIFGLGERVGKLELGDGVYSLWNYDEMHDETGTPPGNNMYSFHPFYLIHTHNPSDFAGAFFLTSNPMDVCLRKNGIHTEMDHILSGGIIELFLFAKGTAEQVMKEYHYIIGKPTPLPFWAFGYHQSRWGYKDIDHLKLIVNRFENEGIPLDGVWMDKDFMLRYKSFTVDTKNWYGLKEFVQELHRKGKHFVAIVDAGIAIDADYDVYTRGAEQKVYIKSSFTDDHLVGITWAGYSVWVDFLSPTASSFWTKCLGDFHSLVEFDGIWLDMNEPSNFCDGECHDHINYHYYYFPLDYYDDLYYNPTHRPLEDNTISMEALHHGNKELANEFNYHSMYGFYQSRHTHDFFVNTLRKRPFVVSSSTFPGSGRYVAHWLGDNYSSWRDMAYSIAGMINFNMFGIPFVGANICGYSGNATVNLCARWMQLGALYPFMRNHNNPEGGPQEPYTDPLLARISKKAIHYRYSLVRYIYTEYMRTVIYGGSMVRPLVFAFPDDNETYSAIDSTFMLGHALRVTPILDDGKEKVETYFPNADWYHLEAPEFAKVMSFDIKENHGKKVTLYATLVEGQLNVHAKSGTIVPMQDVGEGITNVLQVQTLPINLVVIPDYRHMAEGTIFYDVEQPTSSHQEIAMALVDSEISFRTVNGRQGIGYSSKDMYVGRIVVLNAEGYKDAKVARYENSDHATVSMNPPSYDTAKKILTLQPVNDHSMNILSLHRVYWNNTG